MDELTQKIVFKTYSWHSPTEKYVSDLVQAAQHFQGGFPALVWHYTSVESFKKILASQSLMFTHVSSFDDPQEVERAIRVMKMIIDVRLRGDLKPREKILLETARRTMLLNNADSGWYAASLTDSEDDPFHWERYGVQHRGVAIGFDFRELIRFLSPSKSTRVFPAQIIYDTQKSINFGAMVLDLGLAHFSDDFSENTDDADASMKFLKVWGRLADPFSIILKEEKFEQEREWRLGRYVGSATETDSPISFADGKKRWLVSRNEASDSSFDVLPISKIIVGKRCTSNGTEFQRLLGHAKHNSIIVSHSQAAT
jgi:Protein of unknown function (DUF2971)